MYGCSNRLAPSMGGHSLVTVRTKAKFHARLPSSRFRESVRPSPGAETDEPHHLNGGSSSRAAEWRSESDLVRDSEEGDVL